MKRSDCVELLKYEINMSLPHDLEFDTEEVSHFLAFLEQLGMMPPLDKSISDWDDEASVYSKNYKWEPEK